MPRVKVAPCAALARSACRLKPAFQAVCAAGGNASSVRRGLDQEASRPLNQFTVSRRVTRPSRGSWPSSRVAFSELKYQ